MKKKILIVGQTPPPYGGQAMMIKYMLDATYRNMNLYHVRMCFSRDFNDRGKFSLYKIAHIFVVIFSIWKMRFKYGIHTMYYPVSSTPKVALLRDVIILGCSRFLFKELIYHFHAAGISEELPKYNTIIRSICYAILKKPSLAITSSEHNPKDAEYLQAKRIEIVPLGIPDANSSKERGEYRKYKHLTVMFMGLLNETKGEGYLLEAIKRVRETGRDVRLVLAGKFESDSYKQNFHNRIAEQGLQDFVEYKGVVTGQEKKQMFLDAAVFCFPSYFSSESFGIVLLEGMMYQMPLIASKWRGIQSVIEEGRNGFLVDVRNSAQITDAIIELYDNPTLMKTMALEGRKIFEEKYEISNYLSNMEMVLTNAK